MLFGDKQLYEQTRSLKKGESRLSPCMEVLRNKIAERFGIKIVNIVYDKIDLGPSKGRPRLNIIVDSGEDYARIHENQFEISKEAKELILKYFSDVVDQMGMQGVLETQNVLLISDSFAAEAMNQAVAAFLENNAEAIAKMFTTNGVWQITGVGFYIVVFFTTESAKTSALSNGVSEDIRRRCFEAVKRHDEFNYSTTKTFALSFDTKENLDNNFKGNLFYYFK